jgi:hypothetical protein
MTAPTPLLFAELALLAFGLGGTAWFFIVQTPALLRGMGMARFLPLQIRLVKIFAPAMAVVSLGVLALAAARGGLDAGLLPAGIAAVAAVLNATLIVPRAVRAGGQAIRAVHKGEGGDGSIGGFVSEGGGQPTKVWHRLVVVAVLAMCVGLGVEGVHLLGGHGAAHGGHAAAHHHGAEAAASPTARHGEATDARWPADPATVENIHALHATVQATRTGGGPTAAQIDALNEGYRAVFRDCTMGGEAHDALHDLLVPVGEALDRLDEPEHAGAALAEMDRLLATFDGRFVLEG